MACIQIIRLRMDRTFIECVTDIDDSLCRDCQRSESSDYGTGGMKTKIDAAVLPMMQDVI